MKIKSFLISAMAAMSIAAVVPVDAAPQFGSLQLINNTQSASIDVWCNGIHGFPIVQGMKPLPFNLIVLKFGTPNLNCSFGPQNAPIGYASFVIAPDYNTATVTSASASIPFHVTPGLNQKAATITASFG